MISHEYSFVFIILKSFFDNKTTIVVSYRFNWLIFTIQIVKKVCVNANYYARFIFNNNNNVPYICLKSMSGYTNHNTCNALEMIQCQ